MTILDEILENKRGELERAVQIVSPDEMCQRARATSEATRGFVRALRRSSAPASRSRISLRIGREVAMLSRQNSAESGPKWCPSDSAMRACSKKKRAGLCGSASALQSSHIR